jgi:hypothetical protein
MKKFFLLVSVFVLTMLSSCDAPLVVESKWTDSEISINADPAQIKDVVEYPNDPQFGIGVKNDGRYLYLFMISWKREVNSQILHTGFTTWFTSSSKKGKRFGIHFPLGMMKNAEAWHADRESNCDPVAMRARIEESLQRMELLGPEKDDSVPVQTRVAESFGIAVRMSPSSENLVYEIKVPLRQDSASNYAIDIGKDTLIKVTFESTPPDINNVHGGGDESHVGSPGMGGGGMMPDASPGGGRGMHHGGQGGDGKHYAAEEMSGPFKASFSIKLAGKPSK